LDEGASRRTAGRLGRKIDRRRKPMIGWKAAGRTAGGASRRLIGRRSRKVGSETQVDGRPDGQARRLIANASWRSNEGQVKDLTLMRVEGRVEGKAGRWITGASRRSIRKARLKG